MPNPYAILNMYNEQTFVSFQLLLHVNVYVGGDHVEPQKHIYMLKWSGFGNLLKKMGREEDYLFKYLHRK